MFIDTNILVKITCKDNVSYTGTVYKIVLQPSADNFEKFYTLLFISQDKRFVGQEGEFGCASVWLNNIKHIDVLQ